jgi:hypothetical protein
MNALRQTVPDRAELASRAGPARRSEPLTQARRPHALGGGPGSALGCARLPSPSGGEDLPALGGGAGGGERQSLPSPIAHCIQLPRPDVCCRHKVALRRTVSSIDHAGQRHQRPRSTPLCRDAPRPPLSSPRPASRPTRSNPTSIACQARAPCGNSCAMKRTASTANCRSSAEGD